MKKTQNIWLMPITRAGFIATIMATAPVKATPSDM